MFLTTTTSEESVFGWAEAAVALHQLEDPHWNVALETARQAARNRRSRRACEAWERLLEVTLELGDVEAVRQVLEDIRAAGGPPELMRRLLGYSLVVEDAQSWSELGPKAFAVGTSDAVVLEPLTILALHGRFFRRAAMGGRGSRPSREVRIGVGSCRARQSPPI